MASLTLCLGLKWYKLKGDRLLALGNLVQQACDSCSSDSDAFYDDRFAPFKIFFADGRT